MYDPYMSSTMTVSKARAALPEILERVRAGEEVSITRHGQVVAVVVRPDALRARRSGERLIDAARLHDLVASGRQARLRTRATLTQEQADALLADVQASRSRQ